MEQYIPKSALVAEIERRITAYQKNFDKADNKIAKLSTDGRMQSLKELLSFLDTLEVKEVEENKLPNPRFPHLDNIVDKVFGTGNLESWEYEEAKQLVLLAKEELLKDIEVKEVDLEKKKMEWIEQLCRYFKANYLYVSGHESFISDFRRYAKNLK